MNPALLPNLIAAGLVAGLAVSIAVRRPPPPLWPVALWYQVFVLLYLVGDGITLVSGDMLTEQVGIAILYTGSLPAAAACWLLALRYAEAQGRPFGWARGPWIGVPLAATAVAWLGMITNPWHGQFLTPVIGDHNQHHWLWYPLVSVGYILVTASIPLYGALAVSARAQNVRRNALIMVGGILMALGCNLVSYVGPFDVPFDLTVEGLLATSTLFLFGAYRTRLFSLLPIALREIIRHDHDGVVLVDPEGFWLYSNPAASQLIGTEMAAVDHDVLATLSDRLLDPGGQAVRRDALASLLLRAGTASGPSLDLYQAEGERWLRLTATGIPSRSGRVVAISLRFQDVTGQRRAEAALRQSRDELEQRVAERTAALRASEERYRMISKLSSDVSFGCRLGADDRLTWEWLTRIDTGRMGYDFEELRGIEWSTLVHPEDRERLRNRIASSRQGETLALEFRIRTKRGETLWVEMHAQVTRDEETGELWIVGAIRNITERKRTQEAQHQRERQVQAAQRLESLGALAGGIAHDFNNVLAVILGNATLSLEELESPETLRRCLGRIRAAGQYAASLTDQILIYTGRRSVSAVALDLGALVAEMLDLLRASISPKCSVEFELQDGLPAIEGDDTQIRQVIVNLVVNAAEALGDAGGRILLRTGALRASADYLAGTHGTPNPAPGSYVFVEVCDSGPGMDEATLSRVFEPFFTTKFTGRGLGLAAVHGIVHAHRGVIKLKSRPQEGTVFRVLFPRSERHAEPTTREAEARIPPASSATPAARGVLVVDDDEGVLELAEVFLARAGFHVLTARGGMEALQVFDRQAHEIDVVVLDLTMPDMDGPETFQELRARRGDLPVILTSGYSEERAAESFAMKAVHAFLGKPYEPQELVEQVSGALLR